MEEVVKDYYNNNNVTKLCTNHLNWSRSKWISTRLPRDSSSLSWIDPQLKFVEIEAERTVVVKNNELNVPRTKMFKYVCLKVWTISN